MVQRFFLLGAVFAALGVAAGAFGAHSLKSIVSADMLVVFETAVRYQMYHALALLIVGSTARHPPERTVQAAGWCFVVGILLFSGSLYLVALMGIRWFGAITPIGGMAFLAGWIALARNVWLKKDESGM